MLRLVLDANILVSALITAGTPPDLLYKAWRDGRFALITSEEQLSEVARVLAYPKLKSYVTRSEAKELLVGLRDHAVLVAGLPVVTSGSKFVRMEEELRSSIIGTLTQHLSLFRTEDVARATSASNFSAAKLREGATTLYLVVREKDQRALSPLLRMVLTRLLDDLTEKIPAEEEQPVLLMLDEFPLLKAPVIQQKLATARKYRIRTVLLAQTRTQIVDYYGTNESVTGLCDVRVFFPSGDLSTQELASDTCGTTTRWGVTTSHDRKSMPTRTVHESARPLRAHKDWRFQEGSVVARLRERVQSAFVGLRGDGAGQEQEHLGSPEQQPSV